MTKQPDVKAKTYLTFHSKCIEDEGLIENFKKLCIQDGLSLHDALLEAVNLFFKKHNYPPGNPQLTLVNYHVKPLASLGKCNFAHCTLKAEDTALFVPLKKVYNLCYIHVRLAKGSKEWVFKKDVVTEK